MEYTEKTQSDLQVNLTVDGKLVPIIPFVEKIVGDTVEAMVKTLHGCQDAKSIRLDIQRKSDKMQGGNDALF